MCWSTRFDLQNEEQILPTLFQDFAATTPDLKGFEASVKATSVGSFQSINKLAIKRNRMQRKAKDGKAILDTFAVCHFKFKSVLNECDALGLEQASTSEHKMRHNENSVTPGLGPILQSRFKV